MTGRLSRLQSDLLAEFFRLEKRFFLTGGAALAGFHLGHRTTQDLDLFATSDILDDGERALREAARSVGGTMEAIRTAPEFLRRLIRRGDESVIVDLVVDHAAQGEEPKLSFGAVRVDPPREILANKLCTLLSRSELRDLVDVLALVRAGYSVEEALPLAIRKDGGLTPAQLAWVLSEIEIGDDASIPGGVALHELREFIADLKDRLARAAFPGSET